MVAGCSTDASPSHIKSGLHGSYDKLFNVSLTLLLCAEPLATSTESARLWLAPGSVRLRLAPSEPPPAGVGMGASHPECGRTEPTLAHCADHRAVGRWHAWQQCSAGMPLECGHRWERGWITHLMWISFALAGKPLYPSHIVPDGQGVKHSNLPLNPYRNPIARRC